MKRVLITGEKSYIGLSVEHWLMKEPHKYIVEKISLRDEAWKQKDFSKYDVVLHVAGIAHVSTDSKLEGIYYTVNRDLTIETAEKSKVEGVKQFIFLSSIIVYGDSSRKIRIIDKETLPKPSNFYGKSKLEAEEGLIKLESSEFKVAVLRPPMIYGKNSKGNYQRLSRLAKNTPFFPNINNERSMLHIDNLSEFIKLVIDNEDSGHFFPQNKEYVSTSELVKTIAEIHNKKMKLISCMSWFINILSGIDIINKVFGNLVYEKSMSNYDKANYQIRDFRDSIKLTELE